MADTHVLVGTTATLEVTFYADGVPTDDGTPTITITKADGTALVTNQATSSGGTGVRRYVLAAQTNPASLTATWTGSTQVMNTRVEIVGALLFTIAAVRAVKVGGTLAFQSATDYPNTTIADRRVQVTDDFEARTGYSFIPRFAREVFDGGGQGSLILSKYRCQRLLSVAIDGNAQTATDYLLADTGLLTSKFGWTFSDLAPQNVAVEYVYGFTGPPAEVSDAGLARAASLLLPSQVGSTVSIWTTPTGTTYSYDQAGQTFGGGRRYYGIPKIDSVLSDPAYNARRGGVFA